MTTSPAISVLIRTIGRKEALKDALASLQQQSFKDFETVIVEDGPDTLSEFLKAYPDLSITYKALGTRQGRSIAGNHAFEMACGAYCIFLDDDDLFAPDHLQSLLRKAQADNHRVVYSWSEERGVERGVDGKIIRTKRLKRIRRERFSLSQLIAGNFIPINAVLFNRSLYKTAGGFDTDVDLLEDWLLWLRFAVLEPNWACVPHATAIYTVPIDMQARRRQFRAAKEDIREHLEEIQMAWPLSRLQRELRYSFGAALFLRKLYYYLSSFI